MISFIDKQKTLFGRRKALIKRATNSEKVLMSRFDKAKISYVFQKAFIKGNGYYIVDFYLPKPYKICIEVDGGYHDDPDQIKKDKRKDNYLSSRGFLVIRIKNEDVNSFSVSSFSLPKKKIRIP